MRRKSIQNVFNVAPVYISWDSIENNENKGGERPWRYAHSMRNKWGTNCTTRIITNPFSS